jgi:hypothetical protein
MSDAALLSAVGAATSGAGRPYGNRLRAGRRHRGGNWQAEGFLGDKLICSAAGATFDQAMLQTTMVGAEADG